MLFALKSLFLFWISILMDDFNFKSWSIVNNEYLDVDELFNDTSIFDKVIFNSSLSSIEKKSKFTVSTASIISA